MNTSSSVDFLIDLVRPVLKLEEGCQFYNLSSTQYWTLISVVSDLLTVDAATASRILGPLIDSGDININDNWSDSISYVSSRYGVDAATAAQLLSNGLPYLPTDGSLTSQQWSDAISHVSSQYNVNAADAAQMLSVHLKEATNKQNSSMSLSQWTSAISSVSSQYNVDAATAAKSLSNNLQLDNLQIDFSTYPIKCRRVPSTIIN